MLTVFGVGQAKRVATENRGRITRRPATIRCHEKVLPRPQTLHCCRCEIIVYLYESDEERDLRLRQFLSHQDRDSVLRAEIVGAVPVPALIGVVGAVNWVILGYAYSSDVVYSGHYCKVKMQILRMD
jgi:hypothetical protein